MRLKSYYMNCPPDLLSKLSDMLKYRIVQVMRMPNCPVHPLPTTIRKAASHLSYQDWSSSVGEFLVLNGPISVYEFILGYK